MIDLMQALHPNLRHWEVWHVTRLLRTVQIPTQATSDDDSDEVNAEPPYEVEHDHAWRRRPSQRGEMVAEYRCDLCALSYVE